MIAAVEINIKQQETKKKLIPVSYNFSQGYVILKLETQCKTNI